MPADITHLRQAFNKVRCRTCFGEVKLTLGIVTADYFITVMHEESCTNTEPRDKEFLTLFEQDKEFLIGIIDRAKAISADAVKLTVSKTLRVLAEWGCESKTRNELNDLADTLEEHDNIAGYFCFLCKEVTCAEGCPFEEVRKEEEESLTDAS